MSFFSLGTPVRAAARALALTQYCQYFLSPAEVICGTYECRPGNARRFIAVINHCTEPDDTQWSHKPQNDCEMEGWLWFLFRPRGWRPDRVDPSLRPSRTDGRNSLRD